ncbi:2-phospho-L-lactate guanylyltransferase [Ancylobacter oerskovii]|uniref:3-phospho-D-glycerate guanylyltransferase n=1 Tax=Ancylobacter oerskovii TaxID=459519 RepID=A0ABW4Z4Z5_9HYPH|nr:2-phospho-L-lactate guanylyltransferase [Ancylobacter oerskovii]
MSRTASAGIWAVVPVKPFGLAKQRLAPALGAEARARLARAMLEDVLAALGSVGGLAGTLIVSAEPEVEELARDFGAERLAEAEAAGLNTALERAARHLVHRGAAGLLAIPGDVPGLAAAEVARLIGAHPAGRAVSLVAAHDGQGTNALLATPADAVRFCFGPGSLAAHRAAARAADMATIVHEAGALPGIGFDVDAPDDLARLRALPGRSHTRAALAAGAFPPGWA